MMKRLLAWFMMLNIGGAVFAQSVFDMPKLFPQHRQYLAEFLQTTQTGQWLQAETVARSAAKLFPNDANWHYNVACVCARQQHVDEAFKWLEKAIRLGFTNERQLQQDDDLTVLRSHPKFAELLLLAKQVATEGKRNATLNAAIAESVPPGKEFEVTARNTQWEWNPTTGGYMTTLLSFVGNRKAEATAYTGPCSELLRTWLLSGEAAGNAGDLYVNRDEDRTQMAYEKFPLLTPVVYSTEAQRAAAHVGAANGVFASGLVAYPVVGTSVLSLSNTPFWRSLPRLITTEAQADVLSFRLAMKNQGYIYDASSDYSAQFKQEHLVANTAHFFATFGDAKDQGSAKTNVETMAEILFAGLAAMKPETKAEMTRRGLFVPTFQMLLRQNLKDVSDYCSAAAHPTVFDVSRVDVDAFVRAAHQLTSADLPVTFNIVARSESMPRQYVDYFDAPTSERISDTPCSIKRVIRGRNKVRKLTVAASSSEPNISYRWFVVNGDAEKIRIRPLTKSGTLVKLEVDYHGVFEQDGMQKRHVDIACVALRNGKPMSAPAFVSFRYLANEQRVYDEKGRIQSIDYRTPQSGFVYEDPALSAFKNWRDDYCYDDVTGKCLGWKRTLFDGTVQQFDTLGRRVLETADDGTPKRVAEVSYSPRVDAKSNAVSAPAIELLQMDTARILTL